MSEDNQNNIDQLKKNIADYIKFIYGDALENNLQPDKKTKTKKEEEKA